MFDYRKLKYAPITIRYGAFFDVYNHSIKDGHSCKNRFQNFFPHFTA